MGILPAILGIFGIRPATKKPSECEHAALKPLALDNGWFCHDCYTAFETPSDELTCECDSDWDHLAETLAASGATFVFEPDEPDEPDWEYHSAYPTPYDPDADLGIWDWTLDLPIEGHIRARIYGKFIDMMHAAYADGMRRDLYN